MNADTESSTNEMERLVNEGNVFLINQDFRTAEIRFSSAIEALENENKNKKTNGSWCNDSSLAVLLFRSYSHRSAARLALGNANASDALADANCAIHLMEKEKEADEHELNIKDLNLKGVHMHENENWNEKENENENEILSGERAMARGRAGMALFELGEYREAKDAFVHASKLAQDCNCSVEHWLTLISKCEDAMPKLEMDNQNQAPKALGIEPKTNDISDTTKPTKPVCPKYQYYQNDSFMTIAILEPNVQPQDINVQFSIDKLTVTLNKADQQFTVICGTLFDAVLVSKCKVKINDEKVLIKLKKDHKYEWHELFGSGAKDKDRTRLDTDPTTDPINGPTNTQEKSHDTDKDQRTEIPLTDKEKKRTRPYASHRDWDAIERNLKKDEENEKPQGEEAMNKLFRDIYSKADPNTQRAMIKSFQTSGGTVLSTNWDEVQKTDYEKEKQAPKGMEWKNWEGEKLPQKESD